MWDLTQEGPPDQTRLGLGEILVHLLGQPWLLIQADQPLQGSGLFILFRAHYSCALGIFWLCPCYHSPPVFLGNGELIVGQSEVNGNIMALTTRKIWVLDFLNLSYISKSGSSSLIKINILGNHLRTSVEMQQSQLHTLHTYITHFLHRFSVLCAKGNEANTIFLNTCIWTYMSVSVCLSTLPTVTFDSVGYFHPCWKKIKDLKTNTK